MWRANACPSWLFALPAGRSVWGGMGQALAFLGVWAPALGAISLPPAPSWFPQMPQEGAGFCPGRRPRPKIVSMFEGQLWSLFSRPIVQPGCQEVAW
jgi:hypothetical protein